MLEHEAGTADSLAGFSLVPLCHGLEWNKAVNYGNISFRSIGWNFCKLCQLPLEQLSISFKISIAKNVFLELQSILTSNENYLDNVTVIFFALYSRVRVLVHALLFRVILPLSWGFSCLFALKVPCELAKDLTNVLHIFILVSNASSSLSPFKAVYSSNYIIHVEKHSHSLFTRNI